MAKLLIPQTPDLESRGSSLTSGIVSLGKELFSTLSLFCTHMYKMGTADILLGGNPEMAWHAVQRGSSNTPRHASCYGNRVKLRPCGPLARVHLYLFYVIVL